MAEHAPPPESPELSMQLFGTLDFAQYRETYDKRWIVFRNHGTSLSIGTETTRHFHGTTLYQCRNILSRGFHVGMCHRGSSSSPCGVWGCDAPGHAFDRTPLMRGQTGRSASGISAWDCPVALCWYFDTAKVHTHKRLVTGTVQVVKLPVDSLFDVRGTLTQIWVHRTLYERFRELPRHWPALRAGRLVACRARLAYPDDLYRSGDASPMTCGRVVAVESDEFQIWVKASSTKQYRCPWCEGLYKRCRPCTDSVF